MLLYADDMALWAETEEELVRKASLVFKALESLNLKLNPSKTELQHNKYAPYRVGQSITIGSENGKDVTVQYQDTDKPIRYLGAWTTCNKNTDYGLTLLKERMLDRLQRIQHCKAHPVTKVMLAKSKILSLWNYTAAVQDINSKCIEEWDSKLYELVTHYGFARCRKDLIYLDKDKNGLGMTSIKDLYKINRARIVAQIMEAAIRQRGRQQMPWAEKVLMEEITKINPCLPIFEEIKETLGDLGLGAVHNDSDQYRLWTRQQRQLKELSEKHNPVHSRDCFYTSITTERTRLKQWDQHPGTFIRVV